MLVIFKATCQQGGGGWTRSDDVTGLAKRKKKDDWGKARSRERTRVRRPAPPSRKFDPTRRPRSRMSWLALAQLLLFAASLTPSGPFSSFLLLPTLAAQKFVAVRLGCVGCVDCGLWACAQLQWEGEEASAWAAWLLHACRKQFVSSSLRGQGRPRTIRPFSGPDPLVKF